ELALSLCQRHFAIAGWLAGGLTIVCLAFLSFITVSYIVEVMSTTNALVKRQDEQRLTDTDSLNSESSPLIRSSADSFGNEIDELRYPGRIVQSEAPTAPSADSMPFEITRRFELGQMAHMYFNSYLIVAFYAVICIYLYGDLAIYAVAVPKSLRDVACTYWPNASSTDTDNRTETDYCWSPQLFVGAFSLLVCPFAFFNVQKTKYLQVATSLSRWLAFGVMLTLAATTLAIGQGSGHPGPVNWTRIPQLFGASVYSFMCHHSLPALLTPMSPKRHLRLVLLADFSLILVFYLSLAYTGIFAFGHLEDLYTLNFQPGRRLAIGVWQPVRYFLALFPVFALSTSFPIIAITLRGNLKALFGLIRSRAGGAQQRSAVSLAIGPPPVALAFVTSSVDALVNYTGSYAGALLQYAVPALLLHYSRRKAASQLPPLDADSRYAPIHVSPFGHPACLVAILGWTLACMALVTADHLMEDAALANVTAAGPR
uniref:Aa_trans domain-containing protein n=1 Tax=Macrostomum lignano TaxID=282301 RepID=A0A1I8F219_9PLAT